MPNAPGTSRVVRKTRSSQTACTVISKQKAFAVGLRPHQIAGGKKLYEQIDEAIRQHERLLLILSPSSIHSEWVNTEIAKARKREHRRVLFPLRLVSFESLLHCECFDADTGKDSAREIREYFIPGFQ